MKENAYKNSCLKYKLFERKRYGEKEVIWSLTPKQKQFIEELGFVTEVYLYKVNTKTLYNINSVDGLLKQIHFAKKRRKSVIVLKLNNKQKKMLDKFDIKYRPYKYRIKLCN